jgi:hypothetical protein
LRAFFGYTVIRKRGPERNYPQITVWVTFVTRTKSSGELPFGDVVNTFEW